MAETVVINIEANTQGLQSTIDLLVKLGKVEQSVADDFKKTNEQNIASLNKGVQATTKGIESISKAVQGIKADNTLAQSLDATAPLAKTGNSVQSMRSRLKEAVAEAQLLANKFGDLDPRAIEAAKSAAKLKDQIDDTNKRINALNPENKFNAIKNLGGAIGGVFQVATGALQAFGVESEQATKIAQQFQGALNIFAGLSQLGQFKDALVEVKAALGLTTVATEAQAVATEGMAVADGEAVVAQNALNKSILSNPYVIAASAVAALAAAIYVFVSSADEAEQAQKRLNAELESSNAYYKDLADISKRFTNEAVADANNRVKLAELEGKSAKEVGELKKKAFEQTQIGIRNQIKFNEEQIQSDKKTYDQLAKLTDDDSKKKREELAKQIADKQNANKDLISQQKILQGEYKILEAQITKDVQDESKKRIEESKATNEKLKKEEIDNRLFDIKKRYELERIEARKLTDDKEILAMKDTDIALRENAEQLKLYKQGSKEYEELLLTRAKLAQQNEIPIVQKFQVEKAPIPEVKPIEVSLDPQIDLEKLEKSKQLLADKLTELQNASIESLKTIVTDQLNALFENSIQTINDQKDAQLIVLDEQDKAYQESYNKRLIGKRELDANLADSNKKRVEAEKKAEKELNEIRKKQDIAKKAVALFDIALSTSKAVMAVLADPTVLAPAKPALVAATIAIGAVQAAAVMAQPLPKYKKGTLSVGGVGSEDTELALLQPGEAVIPTEINRKYHPAIKAIYNGNIKPEEINNFVNMKLKRDYSSQVVGGVTAKMDVADLYALGRIMKKNDGVVVKNIGELAELMSNQYNPRR